MTRSPRLLLLCMSKQFYGRVMFPRTVFELFFCKKIPLSRRVGYVMGGSVSGSVSGSVRDVCVSHQSDILGLPQQFLWVRLRILWAGLTVISNWIISQRNIVFGI